MGRIVITGGSGFLGSHLCDAFLARGDEVVAIDNFITGRPANVAHLESEARFRLIEHDVITPFDVDGTVDAVLHFASPASPRDYMAYPLETLLVGSEGTRNGLELARRKGARFLVASTSEVYGDPLVHPQPETYWGHVNSVGPRACYDEAKRFGEAITVTYQRTFDVDARILRIFNTYGTRMQVEDGRVVSNFLVQALQGKPITIYGDGTQTRSFWYVSDEVAGIVKLLDSDVTTPVNVGNPNEFTMLELAEVVLDVTGSSSEIVYEPLPEDDPKQRQPDITLARAKLDWEPVVTLREGLESTASYFRSELNL